MIVWPALILLHLALIPAGLAGVFIAIGRANRGHPNACTVCSYDLRASRVGAVCPECGVRQRARDVDADEHRIMLYAAIGLVALPFLLDLALMAFSIAVWMGWLITP